MNYQEKYIQCLEEFSYGTIVYSNEYVNLTYLGLRKGGNFWGIYFLIENKSNFDISVEINDFRMWKCIIHIFPYISFDIKPNTKIINHISMSLDNLFDLGINSLQDMNDVSLIFVCGKGDAVICRSSLITIPIIDYAEELLKIMKKLVYDIKKIRYGR